MDNFRSRVFKTTVNTLKNTHICSILAICAIIIDIKNILLHLQTQRKK